MKSISQKCSQKSSIVNSEEDVRHAGRCESSKPSLNLAGLEGLEMLQMELNVDLFIWNYSIVVGEPE